MRSLSRSPAMQFDSYAQGTAVAPRRAAASPATTRQSLQSIVLRFIPPLYCNTNHDLSPCCALPVGCAVISAWSGSVGFARMAVSDMVARMANTSLSEEFESLEAPDRARAVRRWLAAEDDVDAIDDTVDMVLDGEEHGE
ncbi:hypothetical protein I4F81_012306 [Pyropia yezoensis]|uniref:Uncharacterized protein n=1 Tax=Pyropia yezoensis TaxID=2788 RepID=A0ACC3CJ72_PYRYE|nr:hypothetical protein I4F81_012306 [Neopyropia yezoensis]